MEGGRGYVTNDRFVSRDVTRVILDYRSPIRFLVFNKRKGRSFLELVWLWSGDKYSRSRATTIREKEIGKRWYPSVARDRHVVEI